MQHIIPIGVNYRRGMQQLLQWFIVLNANILGKTKQWYEALITSLGKPFSLKVSLANGHIDSVDNDRLQLNRNYLFELKPIAIWTL